MPRKHCFDSKCLDLARYFYPAATEDRLHDLAQRLQDTVEDEDIELPSPPLVPAPEESITKAFARSPRRIRESVGYDANGSPVGETIHAHKFEEGGQQGKCSRCLAPLESAIHIDEGAGLEF